MVNCAEKTVRIFQRLTYWDCLDQNPRLNADPSGDSTQLSFFFFRSALKRAFLMVSRSVRRFESVKYSLLYKYRQKGGGGIIKEAFNAASSVATIYGGFFKSVAQEIGMERALALHAKLGEPFGIQIGEAFKQKFGKKKPDTESLKAVFQPMMTSFGFTCKYKATPKTLVIVVPKCPLYEGFKAAGLDHKTIEKICKAMSGPEYRQAKKLYPKIEGSVQFKDSPEGSCVEKWTIK